MTGCINDDVFSFRGMKEDLRGIDGDALLLFFLQGVQQERELKTFSLLVTNVFYKLEFAFREASRIREQATHQSGFSVIHMTYDNHPHQAAGKIWSASVITHLHIPSGSKFLHGVGIFLILCPAGALCCGCVFQLFNNLFYIFCIRIYGTCARCTA